MPLIVVTGIPSSGKTTRTKELEEFFKSKGKEVIIVSEEEQVQKAGFQKNTIYLDSNKEKHLRGILKSETLRVLTSNNVVILDALNYIKGYRYELYCGSKANKSTQCTVHTEINRDECWKFNEHRNEEQKYSREVFDALILRYEEPNGNNRWDSPLFLVFPEQTLDMEAIFQSLFKKKPPKPNKATENAPLCSTNFLYEIDRTTQNIVDAILESKRNNKKIEYEGLDININKINATELNNLRRQYLTYSKMNTPKVNEISHLFIQYLNKSLQ